LFTVSSAIKGTYNKAVPSGISLLFPAAWRAFLTNETANVIDKMDLPFFQQNPPEL